MKVYTIVHENYEGEQYVDVFASKEKMMSYLMDDIFDAKLSIKEQGYDFVEVHTEGCGYDEVYAANGNIYYSWNIYENVLRESIK